MQVAEITKDHLFDNLDIGDHTEAGRQFDYDAMRDWWGWELELTEGNIPKEKTKFKLYDDDDELYYEGWLLNDDWCIVQQFVLKWAEVDSGCTLITVYKDAEAGYVQEIG